jgi:hypothetical protein
MIFIRRFDLHSILLAALICLVGTSVLAQTERVYQSAHAVSGKEIRVGLFARANVKECKPLLAPTVRVVAPPGHGTLIIRTMTLVTDRYPDCPHLKVPAQVLFYQSRSNYVGPDAVDVIVTSDDGRSSEVSIAIAVGQGGEGGPPMRTDEL